MELTKKILGHLVAIAGFLGTAIAATTILVKGLSWKPNVVGPLAPLAVLAFVVGFYLCLDALSKVLRPRSEVQPMRQGIGGRYDDFDDLKTGQLFSHHLAHPPRLRKRQINVEALYARMLKEFLRSAEKDNYRYMVGRYYYQIAQGSKAGVGSTIDILAFGQPISSEFHFPRPKHKVDTLESWGQRLEQAL